MKCFNHPEYDAVGICKNCSKGICMSCAVDVNKGLACRDSCEHEVRAMNLVIQRNVAAVKNAGSTYMASVLFMFGLGAVFLSWGLMNPSPFMLLFMLPAGVIFIALGGYNLWLSRRVLKKPSAK